MAATPPPDANAPRRYVVDCHDAQLDRRTLVAVESDFRFERQTVFEFSLHV